MKKLIFPAVIVLVMICSISTFAKVWRVDGNSANKPDKTSLNDAIREAAPGDTIYVAGHLAGYGNITIDKKLALIGTGYFLNENHSLQASSLYSMLDMVTINGGGENSVLCGLFMTSLTINCSNVTIRRNYISSANPYFLIEIRGQPNNILIEQNYIESLKDGGGYDTGAILSWYADNIIIRNNYLQAIAGSECYSLRMHGGTAFVYNNVMNSKKNQMINCSFYNNILMFTSSSTANNDIRNNICQYHPFGQLNGNKEDVDMALVFINSTSPDGRWQLKDGSPAKGAGVNGEDCGMFGGTDPYVLSGIPPIPTIYEAAIPNSASEQEGLKVIIKAKTNK